MKITSNLLLSFLIFFVGCSTSKRTARDNDMQVINATYTHWSHPPEAGSDVPERGTDLSVTLQHWPDECTPEYLVYNQRKSFPATITQQSDSTWLITARIIRMSAKINEKSEQVDASSRLVYTDSQGKTAFLEINDWQRKTD